ncbi:MAG: ferrous iron transport protein A [Chitinophagaceae bacterium]|nr:ferrous iron transport protein A [Chitinophagaceae bacterium]
MKEGESGVIVELERGDLSLKLMEMGFLPGEKIFVDKIAPLGDPISVKIGTYLLSLRKEEANAVLVRSASLVT